ncbi:MAG: ABC transporter ATP-binding protein [Gemmatimonadaceae bacterium]|nr:ABC transporter ATP-binding protein [Gemmatimonadaceae bacterium]
MTEVAPRLALAGISRHYGPVMALDDASLSVAAGEVHALLGENGAGKSTLMKVAFGLEQPDSGTVLVDGQRVALRSPRDAMRHGIGMVQQHFALVDAMTVAENVALGRQGRLDLQDTARRIRDISAESGLPLDPHALVGTLPVGARQRVEIIKALSQHSRILILDEPTAVLSPREAGELLAWARRFADAGGTVILIAHKLREVLSVAHRVTVLRRGASVFTAPVSQVTEADLARAMIGSTFTDAPAGPADAIPSAGARPVITLRNVTALDEQGVTRLADASVEVHAGEILGIAAVEGAGQRELLRVMSGRLGATHGTVSTPPSVGFVPEDRHRDAVVLDATLTENVVLQGAGARRGLVAWATERARTARMMAARDVRAAGPDTRMSSLSGGNQQKLVLGRELDAGSDAIVVENPSRGLDIRATADVHTALRRARNDGTAVVVYSSDLDEVLALADRIVVVAAGRLQAVGLDREAIGRAMLSAGR